MIKRYFFTPLLLFYCVNVASAQSCAYQLILEDLVSEDGWNGGQLTVRVDGVPSTYTLGSGRQEIVYLPIDTGAEVRLDFLQGAFPEETSLRLLNNNDETVFEVTAPPTGQDLFSFTAACVACAPPPANSISLFRERFNSVDVSLRLNPDEEMPTVRVEYVPGVNFDPDTNEVTELLTTDSLFRVEGLEADTAYTFFFSTVCGVPSDTSERRGPFVINTLKEIDLGITLVQSPITGCNADFAPVTLGITNYGGAPQQLFDVGYAIDGVEVDIDRPFDGFFTGVVGVDSTEFFTLDNTIALPDGPGKYIISAYTDIEDDEDRSNDTVNIRIVNQPTIFNYPYHEDFEANDGLWIVERGNRGPASWAWGRPRGTFNDRAPQGRNAWATNLFGDYFNNEESFLESPCFDFTSFSEDPYFSAALVVRTEEGLDNLRLEMSTDDGDSWSTVGISPADVNWYNDRPRQVWDGDGGFGGEARVVANLLEGAAGEVVKLRFAFRTSLDDTDEGIILDAVSIAERPMTDVAVVAIDGDLDCPQSLDFTTFNLSVSYQNIGTSVVDTVFISYPTLRGVRQETVVERLAPGNVRSFTFPPGTSADGPIGNPVAITVTATNDENSNNDVGTLPLMQVAELPFYEEFTNGELPEQWLLESNAAVGADPTTGSLAIIGSIDAASESDTLMSFTTAFYEFEEGIEDTLRFTLTLTDTMPDDRYDLRLITFGCSTIGAEGVMLDSIQSGEYAIPLSDLDEGTGGLILFQLIAVRGSATAGFDDVNIRRCPPTLDLIIDVIPATTTTATNARLTVFPNAGEAPYTYLWSTGATTQTVDGLPVGRYQVTVTDRFGCTTIGDVRVQNFVGTEDPTGVLTGMTATPNPTSGLLNLNLELPTPRTVLVEVYDATGHRLSRVAHGRVQSLRADTDLSAFPAGMYLLRVQADGAARTIRVFRR